MALYLKYRPQNLSEIIGQDNIKKTLTEAFVSDKLSHAYLFVGPRGTGKTSTARILAKMVNCEGKGESGKGEVPCNKCQACISITDGSNLDLIEIDAASNRGIDDIRSLKETIKLSPINGKKKIYIIDEVHMLTAEAFNALLKTLEEPPAHVLFIMATTDASKIPQTILSRVQRLDFKLATNQQLLDTLQKIAASEKIEIEDEALQLLSKKAEGSFRDGVKLLDQVASSGKKVEVSDVIMITQTVEFEVILQMLKNIAEKKATEALLLLNSNIQKGSDVRNWLLSLQDYIRDLVLIKNGLGSTVVAEDLSEDKFKGLVEVAEKFSITDLIKVVDKLQEASEKVKFASIPSLPLEIALVEICSAAGPASSVSIGSSSLTTFPPATPNDTSSLSPAETVQVSDKQPSAEPEHIQNKSDDAASPEVATLLEKWNFVLETIKPYNFSLEALLRLVKVLDVRDGAVLLEVPYSFHQRILEAPKSRDLLESVLSDILGKPAKVNCVLGNRPLRVEDIANVEIAADDEVVKAAAEIFGSEPIN
ncbi:MAG: DNA polymerase III subunit gamma/tau [Candidatus Daviesbacteria bacterium]|nr:DNA polymerase III subunit gamma/tau [Candidatus Daviesbacteria bacterium]